MRQLFVVVGFFAFAFIDPPKVEEGNNSEDAQHDAHDCERRHPAPRNRVMNRNHLLYFALGCKHLQEELHPIFGDAFVEVNETALSALNREFLGREIWMMLRFHQRRFVQKHAPRELLDLMKGIGEDVAGDEIFLVVS